MNGHKVCGDDDNHVTYFYFKFLSNTGNDVCCYQFLSSQCDASHQHNQKKKSKSQGFKTVYYT